jgi:beta-lactamase class A
VGLEQINRRMELLVPGGFHPITTLSEVRALAYQEFHPAAASLTNADFLALKGFPAGALRLREISRRLRMDPRELKHRDFFGGFEAYYSREWNSASLRAYGMLLEKIVLGEALPEAETQLLLSVMGRVETGKNRVIRGLGPKFSFAHKTGTQVRRVCDFGIAWDNSRPGKKVLLSSCAKGYPSEEKAEAALAEVGSSLKGSGIFAP